VARAAHHARPVASTGNSSAIATSDTLGLSSQRQTGVNRPARLPLSPLVSFLACSFFRRYLSRCPHRTATRAVPMKPALPQPVSLSLSVTRTTCLAQVQRKPLAMPPPQPLR
jgi:hypothetical protein